MYAKKGSNSVLSCSEMQIRTRDSHADGSGPRVYLVHQLTAPDVGRCLGGSMRPGYSDAFRMLLRRWRITLNETKRFRIASVFSGFIWGRQLRREVKQNTDAVLLETPIIYAKTY